MTPEFWITTIALCLAPGTGVVLTVVASLAYGIRTGLVTAFGCTVAVVPHLLAAALGAAVIFATNAVAFAVLKWAGVGYLLWLAWGTVRERGALRLDADVPPGTDAQLITRAVLANALNPKLSIFFFAFLPQFVDTDASGQPGLGEGPVLPMLGLGLVVVLVTGVTMAGYALAATAVRRFIVGRPAVMAWFRRVVAVSFVGLGVRLALAQH